LGEKAFVFEKGGTQEQQRKKFNKKGGNQKFVEGPGEWSSSEKEKRVSQKEGLGGE